MLNVDWGLTACGPFGADKGGLKGKVQHKVSQSSQDATRVRDVLPISVVRSHTNLPITTLCINMSLPCVHSFMTQPHLSVNNYLVSFKQMRVWEGKRDKHWCCRLSLPLPEMEPMRRSKLDGLIIKSSLIYSLCALTLLKHVHATALKEIRGECPKHPLDNARVAHMPGIVQAFHCRGMVFGMLGLYTKRSRPTTCAAPF